MRLSDFYFKVKIIILLVIMPLATNYDFVGITAVFSCMIDALYCVSRSRGGGLKVYASSFFAACLYLVWNVLIFILFDYSGIKRLIQIACVILCFFSSCCLERGCIDLRLVRNVIAFQIMLFCAWWPVSGFVTNYYSAFYGHGNFLGGLLVVYLALLMFVQRTVDENRKVLYRILYGAMAFLLVMSNNRAVYLTIAAMLCGGLFVKTGKPQNTRMRGMVLLLCAVAVSVAITVIYPQLLNTSLGIKLELISRTVFHKNFFSGRQEIWKNIEELIIRSPYIGYGLAATPSAFYTTDYSCHSLWLQTALQSGIPGILLLLGLYINAIFRSYHQENRTWYLIASFGAAYIIHESFEVSLTQNNFCLGISVWFFLGLAIAFRKNRLLMIKEKKQAGRYYAESE